MNRIVIANLNLISLKYPTVSITNQINENEAEHNITNIITFTTNPIDLSTEIEFLTTILKTPNEYIGDRLNFNYLKYTIQKTIHYINFNYPLFLSLYYNNTLPLYIEKMRQLFSSHKISICDPTDVFNNEQELLICFILHTYIDKVNIRQSQKVLSYFAVKNIDQRLGITVNYLNIFSDCLPNEFYAFFDEIFIKEKIELTSKSISFFDHINNNKLLIGNTNYVKKTFELCLVPSSYQSIVSFFNQNPLHLRVSIIIQINQYDKIFLPMLASGFISALVINEYKINQFIIVFQTNPISIWVILGEKVNYNELVTRLKIFNKNTVTECLIFFELNETFYKIELSSIEELKVFYFHKESIAKRRKIELLYTYNYSQTHSYSSNNNLLYTIFSAYNIQLSLILSCLSFIPVSSITIKNNKSCCVFCLDEDFVFCVREFNRSPLSEHHNYLCDIIHIETLKIRKEVESIIENVYCDIPCRVLIINIKEDNSLLKEIVKNKNKVDINVLLTMLYMVKKKYKKMYRPRLLFIVSQYLPRQMVIKYRKSKGFDTYFKK